MFDEQRLWPIAVEDAGLPMDRVSLTVAGTAGLLAPASEPMKYWAPGAPVQPGEFPLAPDETAALRAAQSKHRVAILENLEEPHALALMRVGLEFARQVEISEPLFTFGMVHVNASLDERYRRLGSATVYQAYPHLRDAQAEAGRLVREAIEPQFGSYALPFGELFRQDYAPGGLDTLARRTVVFAALHADDVEAYFGGRWELDNQLQQIDPNAGAWWDALASDDGFQHLRGALPFFIPSDAEIEEAPATAKAEPWRPLIGLIDRALKHGLSLL